MVCPECNDRDPKCYLCALFKQGRDKPHIVYQSKAAISKHVTSMPTSLVSKARNSNANISARDLLDLHRFWRETGTPAIMLALLKTQPDRVKAAFEHFGLIEDYERLLEVTDALRGLKLRRFGLSEMARRLIVDCTERFDKAFDYFVKEQEQWSIN